MQYIQYPAYFVLASIGIGLFILRKIQDWEKEAPSLGENKGWRKKVSKKDK